MKRCTLRAVLLDRGWGRPHLWHNILIDSCNCGLWPFPLAVSAHVFITPTCQPQCCTRSQGSCCAPPLGCLNTSTVNSSPACSTGHARVYRVYRCSLALPSTVFCACPSAAYTSMVVLLCAMCSSQLMCAVAAPPTLCMFLLPPLPLQGTKALHCQFPYRDHGAAAHDRGGLEGAPQHDAEVSRPCR